MTAPGAIHRYWLLRLLEALALLWVTLRIAYHGAIFFLAGIGMLFGEISIYSAGLIGVTILVLTNGGVMALPAKPRRIRVIAAAVLMVLLDISLVALAVMQNPGIPWVWGASGLVSLAFLAALIWLGSPRRLGARTEGV